MKYKQYQKYKNSGVEWIGEIPEYWREIPLKYEYKIQKGKNPSELYDKKTEECITYLSMDFLRGSSNHIYAKKNDGVIVHNDDLLILWDGSNAGEILKSQYGILSTTMAVLNQIGDKLDPEYSFYQLKILEKNIQANTIGMGIPHVDGNYFRNLKLILPTKEEQKQIGNFLQKETKQFDDLISKSQSQVNLLQEKRQATINQAVTKGLDPSVEIKNSGIVWLGDIAKHWKINKIKFTSYVKGRIGWQGLTTDEYIDEGPYLVTGTDFEDGKINWKTCHHIEKWRFDQDPYIQLKNNDVLITKDGTIGKIAFVDDLPGDTTLNSGVMVVRPLKNSYLPKYFNWILNSSLFTDFIDYIKSGTTINHLYQEEFGKFTFPIPPEQEQEQINDFLEEKITQFDELTSKIQKQITLLEEKREALITAAVTGKIDVRGSVVA